MRWFFGHEEEEMILVCEGLLRGDNDDVQGCDHRLTWPEYLTRRAATRQPPERVLLVHLGHRCKGQRE